MPRHASMLAAIALLCVQFAAARPAQSGQTFHTCAGFIDSIPATITTQGVWCLRKDLSTAITAGNAITVSTNNVTIDCNGFKLGGLAAGDQSGAIGIHSQDRKNTTVRNCSIRGFNYGISLSGEGHVVRDNLLDNNLSFGATLIGRRHLAQGNRVYDTGGRQGSRDTTGLIVHGHAVDNIVSGVFAQLSGGSVRGIHTGSEDGARVSGNIVTGLGRVDDDIPAEGILAYGKHVRISDNHVVGHDSGTVDAHAIWAPLGVCIRNTVAGFGQPLIC